ncbi:MAG: dipeptidase [Bacteroidales bacterium]|nr:dipeptidase [Candidatus Colimorpha pelethequi]
MKATQQYIEANKDRFLDELFELIRIPSISSESEHKPDMIRCAEQWRKLLLQAGADKAELLPTSGNPLVYGEKIIDPAKKTILVYGHYDVMPVAPLELWNTDPFEPVVKDGKIWARGADDDKGQSFMQAKAFETMVATNSLPCNVKFIFEGEEEIGSPSLAEWIVKEENKKLLKADVILVSDTDMVSDKVPSICTGLRGLCKFEMRLTGPDHDLHSGDFGGTVSNPVNVLSWMIGTVLDKDGHITIPGFYDDVLVVSPEERALINQAPYSDDAYKKSVGVEVLHGEKDYTTLERIGIRPTFDVCGIQGGYSGEGFKTIIPSEAWAKLSFRLVANQNPQRIAKLVEDYFRQIAPESVKLDFHFYEVGKPYVCPIDLPEYRAAEEAFKETCGMRPIPAKSGCSISIVSVFERELGLKSILMGFGLGADNIHAPNENYRIDRFFKGIETAVAYFQHYCDL